MPSFEIPESAQHFIALDVAPRVTAEGRQDANEDGEPMWECRVASLGEPEPGQLRVPMPEVVRVTVAGARPQLTAGARVAFVTLVLRSWRARDGREGLMYTANGISDGGRQTERAPAPAPGAPEPRGAK